MAAPYVGEIRMFAGNFAPSGWQFCEGQLLPISEYEALFNVIGTYYGGDGQSTFALPDLRGRVPIHMGTLGGITYVLAEMSGVEEVTLTVNQLPTHTHPWVATSDFAQDGQPAGKVLAQAISASLYRRAAPNVSLNAASVLSVGGSQPHTNFQPYLCVDFIISMFGIFPSPT